VAFGLQAVDHKLRIWCANVGAIAFVIESVVLQHLNHQTMEHSEVSVLPSGSLESFSLAQIATACPGHAAPGLLWMMDPYGKKYQVAGATAE